MEKRTPPNIETIFLEVVELPVETRLRALDERCGGDATLRARVERLLRADEANDHDSSLKLPAARWAEAHGQAPTRVGGYLIAGIAGEGGTGTVFDAVHESTRRRAAIKLIRAGLSTAHGRQRLEIEAETLGRLGHDGIARLYEAGFAEVAWSDGASSRSPFIAMEFIENATSVTQFARQKALSPRDSVRLIARIARAVQHAHQRGVIHRDLKPGNVLVDLETGVPKVVDFGIARLLDAAATGVTQTGQVIGTLRYMSPEQANADAKLIDARTDIYSLGAMLFELLSGRPVVDAPGSSSAAALVQLVNTDPPRLASLRREFQGDLDAIVHKSIERNPDDRYASAAALADDLERYLDGREVSARAPTPAEQIVRLVKRNKVTAVAVVLVSASITVGAVAATWGLVQADRARREEARQRTIAVAQSAEAERQRAEAEKQRADADRQRIEAERQRIEADRRREEAEAITSFLTNDILGKAGPANIPDKAVRDVIVQKLIDPAAAGVGQRFKDKPLVEAAVRSSISATYTAIGRSDLALPQALVALEIHRRVLGNEDWRTITTINNVGYLHQALGKLAEAEPFFREALDLRRRLKGEDDTYTLLYMNNLGSLLLARGKTSEAEELWRTVLARRRATSSSEAVDTLIAINNLGSLLEIQGKLDEAEPLRQEVLDIRLRTLGEKHPDTLISMNNMAFLRVSQKRLPEAEVLMRRTLQLRREVMGDNHPQTLTAINNMASVVDRLGKPDEAESLWREAYERRLALLGDRHPDTLISMSNLAFSLQKGGKLDQAGSLLRTVLERQREILGSDHRGTLVSMDALASLLTSQGRFEEALPLHEEVLNRAKTGPAYGRDQGFIQLFASKYARCLDGLKRTEEAAEVRREFGLRPPGATRPSTQATTRAATQSSTRAATQPTPGS